MSAALLHHFEHLLHLQPGKEVRTIRQTLGTHFTESDTKDKSTTHSGMLFILPHYIPAPQNLLYHASSLEQQETAQILSNKYV